MKRSLGMGAVFGLVAALATAAALEWRTGARMAALERSTSELRARLDAEPLRRLRAEIDEFRKAEKLLAQKVMLIESLRATTGCPDKVLASAIPGPVILGPVMALRRLSLKDTSLMIEARARSARSATLLAGDLASNNQARVDRLSFRGNELTLTATLAAGGCPRPAAGLPPRAAVR